ncbi:RNA 2'-phosphotransferase [Gymnodinialimonas hymeniacidonis]|uniref:RNA 2'-phosphotransferase n=1 Tax=Gymnodinialimonas hymeniacidonis TaxID=3126508 RepID=UPI0034C5C14E
MDAQLAKISKFLSFVLRHKPDAIGLSLDPEGWADIDELLQKADIEITRAQLESVVKTNDKKRFAVSDDGLSIRANQGHSIEVNLGLEPVEPPDVLYHGTATRFLEQIKAEGLLPRSRQFVHLSPDVATATSVGKRHGKVVVLTVQARALHDQGHAFYRAENGVWLTKFVPPESIQES